MKYNRLHGPVVGRTIPFLPVMMLFIGIHLQTSAQQQHHITFERISTDMIRYEKGLSQNTVQCIMQDRFGFMWFGTWDGLNKYDGYSFSVWNEDNGLSSQNIQAILEDHDGLIWIGTEDGLNVYDRARDKITIYRHDHRNESSLVHNRIRAMCLDKKGDVWIGTNRGISHFQKKTGKFVNYRHDIGKSSSLINNWINDIFCDHNGNIWIATFKGLERFDQSTKSFVHFNRSTGWDSIAMLPVYCIVQHPKDKKLWIGTQSGLYLIDHQNQVLEKINLKSYAGEPEYLIYNLMFDDKENLWVGTARNGVIIFNSVSRSGLNLKNLKDNPQTLSSDQVYSLFQDDAGIIWIGTYSGLNKYDRNSSKFRHHRQVSNDPTGLLSDVIFGFYEDDDGTVWVGSENGINIFYPEKGTFGLLKDPLGHPTPLINALVRTFYKDKLGNIWIGSTGGLTRYDPKSRQKKHYSVSQDQQNSLVNNFVWKIAEDPNGKLWIATERGLSLFDPKSEYFVNFLHQEESPGSLPDNNVFDIFIDKFGKVWFATGSGLCYFEPLRQKFIPAIPHAAEKFSANQRRVSSIYEDKNGIFWLGTFGGGLMRYSPQSGEYNFFTEKNGLPNNVIYKVIDDQNGNLWIPTNRGLAKFNVRNETFITYGLKDGIQSNEFNLGAAMRARNGRIFFGGMNGFNSFFPDEIRKNEKPARIAVSGFYVFDKLIYRELFNGDTIRLKYSENFFAFNFTTLDYANPAKNQYKYYLENFEKGWVSTDAYERLAEYTNVPPGKYRFRVKGSNNDGIWNEDGIAITLIISPPWYATWLFRGSMISSVILLIYIMVMGRIRRINRKHLIEKQFLEMEKQYFDLEQKALRLQMNPHFIFNTLNSIQSYMINNDADTAIEYLAKFARLMRQVLANSRESFIAVREELVALRYYLEIEQLRFDDKFSFEILTDPVIDDEFTGVPPMILQPYVENAIIHGLMYKKGKGIVQISLMQHPDCIFCVVEDDGVGREKAMQLARDSGLERKSSGMLITQQRLDILNKNNEKELKVNVVDKYDEHGLPCGTRVEIRMPFIEI
jgi:ligand-binding sensor domain-containing protein/two-component sensor histidine kinase